MEEVLLSICIPSYNRPLELIRLLNSIDCIFFNKIEIVICEDYSPKRNEIRNQVSLFCANNVDLNIKYFENEVNLGYDRNLVELISKANGEFIMFMGDDDFFISNNLNEFINFIKSNNDNSYFLRRYIVKHPNGTKEDFRYYSNHKFFEAGIGTFLSLFRKSVFISGFTFKKSSVKSFYFTDDFNGTLLYQLFLCGELALNYKTAYCDIPITFMDLQLRGIPEFGSSGNESSNFTPGSITISNSINFMKSFMTVTDYFDRKYNGKFSDSIKKDLSKYSYPILATHREKGLIDFIKYCISLNKVIRLNTTLYYYLYFLGLLILNTKACNFIIFSIKKYLGRTPSF